MFSRLSTYVFVGLMAGGGVLAAPAASKGISARQNFGRCVETPMCSYVPLLTSYLPLICILSHITGLPITSRKELPVPAAKFTVTRIRLLPLVSVRLKMLAQTFIS